MALDKSLYFSGAQFTSLCHQDDKTFLRGCCEGQIRACSLSAWEILDSQQEGGAGVGEESSARHGPLNQRCNTEYKEDVGGEG